MSQSRARRESDRVLVLLDHFKVRGVSGGHDVLVLQATGPHLGAMFDNKPIAIQQTIKSLIRSSCAWGLAQRKHYIWDSRSRRKTRTKCDNDLGLSVSRTNDSSGRAASDQFLLQIPSSSWESPRVCETGIRIVNMEEGSSLWSKSCPQALSFRSIPHRRSAPKHPYSVTSSGARKWSLYVAQN